MRRNASGGECGICFAPAACGFSRDCPGMRLIAPRRHGVCLSRRPVSRRTAAAGRRAPAWVKLPRVTRLVCLTALLALCACDGQTSIAGESTRRVVTPVTNTQSPLPAPTSTTTSNALGGSQAAPTLPWATAKAPSKSERRSLRAFYTRLDEKSFRDHFRAGPPPEADAAESRQALRPRPFLLELGVPVGTHRAGVYLETPDGKPAVFRWVWPIDVGDGIFLVRHKPRVNAGTSAAQLRRTHTWLMDAPTDPKLVAQMRAEPEKLRFRALWQARGARTDRYPVLVVRVVAWQLSFGDLVLHTETDDR